MAIFIFFLNILTIDNLIFEIKLMKIEKKYHQQQKRMNNFFPNIILINQSNNHWIQWIERMENWNWQLPINFNSEKKPPDMDKKKFGSNNEWLPDEWIGSCAK